MAIRQLSGEECKLVAGGGGQLISTVIDDGIEIAGDVLYKTGLGQLIPDGLKVVGAVIGSKAFKAIFTALHL